MCAAYPQSTNKISTQNKIKLINAGLPYFTLLTQLINEAKESIHLQTYIFNDDETGQQIANALIAAAKRKVSVHLMVDGYASKDLPKHFIDELKEAGVKFKFFEPFFKSKHFYFGRRLHHKVFVADAVYALVGGMNIADRYNDLPNIKAWLDFALIIEGALAKDLCVLCWKTWNGFPKQMGITPCEEKNISFNFTSVKTCNIRMSRNDWVRSKKEISTTYLEMFKNSQSHITIVCSYFLPGKIIRSLLRNASKRGVKIKVITAGKSDILMAKYAERWMYDWLLRNKIELYEYQPTVLHAKIAVCDNEWFTVGSYNINDISAYASVELNIDVFDAAFTRDVESSIDNIIKNDRVAITRETHIHTKNIIKQFNRWLSYHFIRIVFFLFTFYFKQEK
jgi:cardiolipin synthase A/B